jgi:hypothetical protein
MGALGMRVLVNGARHGGVMLNDLDVATHRAVNMNGRATTYGLEESIQAWPQALPGVTLDVRVAALELAAALTRIG